jgi:hypothetical protein
MSNEKSIDTNQTARRRISEQVPIERNGGAKPRLVVENTASKVLPFKDTKDAATVNSDKRLLEE